VFDPDAIADRATFDSPTLTPVGIEATIVNGIIAARSGEVTSRLPGKLIRRGLVSQMEEVAR